MTTPERVPLLILAGGLATRLKGLAKDTPKYLQPIDDKNVFADIHLKWAAHHGFKRIFLSVGHLGEKIQSHCQDGERYGLEISYLFDGDRPLGTGGAVRASLKFPFEAIAVTYGDTLLKVPVQDFLQKFERAGLQAAMTAYRNRVPGHVCNIDLRGERVTYDKSQPRPEWEYIDYGFLALKRGALEEMWETPPFDLATPLSRLAKVDQVFGFEIQERFWEIGSPEALNEFRNAFQGDFSRLYR